MSQSADTPQRSDFCQTCYINLAERYCGECGHVFCLHCARQKVTEFYTCSRCGPDHVEETEEGFICQKCMELVRLASRRDYLCPNCGSTTVTPIHNMRQDLVSRFRTTYYRLRTGHEMMAGFVARLRTLRWRVRELRVSGFLHDPEIEKQLLTLVTTQLPSVHERIVFRARNVVERHRASKVRFLHPEQWTITDFPLLAGLIQGIQEDITDYETYCQGLVKDLDGILAVIEERLAPLERWHKLFSKHNERLELDADERPVAAIHPVRLHKTSKSEGVSRGILFITTRQLLFVGRKGFFTKDIRVIHAVPLATITNVIEEGRLRKRLLLIVGEEELKLQTPAKNFQKIQETITLAEQFTDHSLVTLSGSMRVLNQRVDVTSLRDELDQLIDQAVTSDEATPKESNHLIPSITIPLEAYSPSLIPQTNEPPEVLEQSPLFQLEQQKYSIQATIQLLKRQFEEGKIVNENFFKQYRSLTRELYLVETRIKKLAGRRYMNE